MRRLVAIVAAAVLAASLAGPSLALVPPPAPSFTGDFMMLDDGNVLGRVSANLTVPSERQLVPGSYDFNGAPGNVVREAHSVIWHTSFWTDPGHEGGSKVAYADGFECVYFGVYDSDCGEFAVMFIDVLDPSKPDQVAFSKIRTDEWWDFDPDTGRAWWFDVGPGAFKMLGEYPVG